MPLVLNRKPGEEVPMRNVRLSDYEIGDTVQGRYANFPCTGIIVGIDKLCEKIIVDIGGVLSQVDPDDITYVPYYQVLKNMGHDDRAIALSNSVYQDFIK